MKEQPGLLTIKTVAILASVATVIVFLFAISSQGANHTSKPSSAPTVTASPTPESTPNVTEKTPLYANCAEVWKALGRPITKDDPGFPTTTPNNLDVDSDGIGCEDDPSTKENEASIDWKSIWNETKGNARDFANSASKHLQSFWSNYGAPSLGGVWDSAKQIFGGN